MSNVATDDCYFSDDKTSDEEQKPQKIQLTSSVRTSVTLFPLFSLFNHGNMRKQWRTQRAGYFFFFVIFGISSSFTIESFHAFHSRKHVSSYSSDQKRANREVSLSFIKIYWTLHPLLLPPLGDLIWLVPDTTHVRLWSQQLQVLDQVYFITPSPLEEMLNIGNSSFFQLLCFF